MELRRGGSHTWLVGCLLTPNPDWLWAVEGRSLHSPPRVLAVADSRPFLDRDSLSQDPWDTAVASYLQGSGLGTLDT